jgi:hypothetical protein
MDDYTDPVGPVIYGFEQSVRDLIALKNGKYTMELLADWPAGACEQLDRLRREFGQHFGPLFREAAE